MSLTVCRCSNCGATWFGFEADQGEALVSWDRDVSLGWCPDCNSHRPQTLPNRAARMTRLDLMASSVGGSQ